MTKEWNTFDTAPDTMILAWCPLIAEDGSIGRIGQMIVGWPMPAHKRKTKKGIVYNLQMTGDSHGKLFHATHWMKLPAIPE